jgi:hypothetical protein
MCQVPGLVVAMLVHAHAHTRFGRHGRYVEALQATFDKYKAEVVARVCVYVRALAHVVARLCACVHVCVRACLPACMCLVIARLLPMSRSTCYFARGKQAGKPHAKLELW